QRIWPEEYSQSEQTHDQTLTGGRYEGVFEAIKRIPTKNEVQRSFQTQALKPATDMAQTRWLLFVQKDRSISAPFFIVMIFWFALLFASFILFAPANAMAFITLLVCNLAVCSALFLILELDTPFKGMMKVSSAPLRAAQAQLLKDKL